MKMKLTTLISIYRNIGYRRLKQFLTYNTPFKGLKNDYSGTVDDIEYEGLVSLAHKAWGRSADGNIVEIGALFGLSTQAILEGGAGKVVVIDNFQWNPIGLTSDRHESMLSANLRYFIRKGRVVIFKGTSSDYINNKLASEKVAMVFIDADHSYEGVLKDINMAELLNAPIICGDDYNFPGVKQAVHEIYGSKVKFIGEMWWVEK
jgi:hypothetical protein